MCESGLVEVHWEVEELLKMLPVHAWQTSVVANGFPFI
jgi:hypothetical protein